jgi:PAS domain S-box-containing protein
VPENLIDPLRFLEQRLQIGVCWVKLSAKRMIWSEGIYELFDCDRNVPPSRGAFHERMHPADRRNRDAVNLALQKRISFVDSFRVILSDRRVRWIRACGEFLVNDQGDPDTLLLLMADRTAEQHQHEMLQCKTKYLQTLACLSRATVTTADRNGRMTNVIYRQPFSRDAQMLGTRWIDWTHPDDRDQILSIWRAAVQRGEPFELEARVRSSDGSQSWRRTRAAPVRSSDGEILEWIAASFDIEGDRTGQALLNPSQPATGAQLRAARALLRLSVERLSKSTGVSIAVIRRLEELDGASASGAADGRRLRGELEKRGVLFLFPKGMKPTVTLV